MNEVHRGGHGNESSHRINPEQDKEHPLNFTLCTHDSAMQEAVKPLRHLTHRFTNWLNNSQSMCLLVCLSAGLSIQQRLRAAQMTSPWLGDAMPVNWLQAASPFADQLCGQMANTCSGVSLVFSPYLYRFQMNQPLYPRSVITINLDSTRPDSLARLLTDFVLLGSYSGA